MFRDQKESLLVTEPLVGYRSFQVRQADGGLFSLSYSVHWPTDRELVATCTMHVRAPERTCSCGIYAAKTLEWLAKEQSLWPDPEKLKNVYQRALLVGAVHLWGKTQSYTEGYRAERARVVVIYYQPNGYEVAKKAAHMYGAVLEELPDIAPPPEVIEDAATLSSWKQRAREQARERYKKKAEALQKLKAEAKAKGYMDEKGQWTEKAKELFRQKEGGDA